MQLGADPWLMVASRQWHMPSRPPIPAADLSWQVGDSVPTKQPCFLHPADPTCLSRAPAYFAALGEAVQASAAQACGGDAGTALAQALADAPTLMAQAGE